MLTVEVICHGVGSNRFFEDYILDLERKYKSKAVRCSFRGKSRPHKIQEMYVEFENGKKLISPAARYDWFYTAYLGNYLLRPACFSCKYAQSERYADISIADYWQSSKGKAKSLIITNSILATKWIEQINDDMLINIIQENDVYLPNTIAPSPKPVRYDEFWEVYLEKGYLAAQCWLGNNTGATKCKLALAYVLYYLRIPELIRRIKGIR